MPVPPFPRENTDYAAFPSASLSRFLTAAASVHMPLFRAHNPARDPRYFGNTGGGRFDLASPKATIYVADTVEAALRETLRGALSDGNVVSAALADRIAVTELRPATTWRCADLGSERAASFGAIRALSSMDPYDVPHAWAMRFAESGFDGIRYQSAYTSGSVANAWALFSRAGQRESLFDRSTTLSGRDACGLCGIDVLAPVGLQVLSTTTPAEAWAEPSHGEGAGPRRAGDAIGEVRQVDPHE